MGYGDSFFGKAGTRPLINGKVDLRTGSGNDRVVVEPGVYTYPITTNTGSGNSGFTNTGDRNSGNTNTGDDPWTDTRQLAARQTVFHDAMRPSHLIVPTLELL